MVRGALRSARTISQPARREPRPGFVFGRRCLRMNPRVPWLFVALLAALPLQCLGVDAGLIISADVVAAVVFVLRHTELLQLSTSDAGDGMVVILAVLWTLSCITSELVFPEFGSLAEVGGLRATALRRLIHLSRLLFWLCYYVVLKNYVRRNPQLIQGVARLLLLVVGLLGIYACC